MFLFLFFLFSVRKQQKERRDEIDLTCLLFFALKTRNNERFGKKWFIKNDILSEREVREGTRKMYKEKKTRTERAKNNPLNVMVRMLNEYENDIIKESRAN